MDTAVSHLHSQSQSEKSEVGPQSTPPRAGNLNPDAAETFAHAEPPPSSSFPLLQKLRVDRKWRTKWRSKKQSEKPRADHGSDPEAGQEAVQGDEDVDVVEETGEGTSMLGRSSRTSTSYLSAESNNQNWDWSAAWAQIRRFLPVGRIAYHHTLMGISIVGIILLCKLIMIYIYIFFLHYHMRLSSVLIRVQVSW